MNQKENRRERKLLAALVLGSTKTRNSQAMIDEKLEDL